MPLSSSVNSSDSRYSIQSIASLGRPSHCGLMHHGCMLEFRCPTNYNFMLHLVQVRWVASNWSTTGPVMCHALWWCWAHHWCHQQHRWICAAVSGRCVRALPCPPSLQGWVLCILGHHGHRGHVVDKHRTQRGQFCQHLRWQVPMTNGQSQCNFSHLHVGIHSHVISDVNPRVSQPQAQLMAVSDSMPPVVAPGLQDEEIPICWPTLLGIQVVWGCLTHLTILWGCEGSWLKLGKALCSCQVTSNGAK